MHRNILEESGRQVTRRLDDHLERLPANDGTSRTILTKMCADDVRRAEGASGCATMHLPLPVRKAMQAASRVMTGISFRL
ncbi:MAG: hypothetical protein CL799_00220 [Chromatiales bacterium]|nr:hypothetical protein [Chromatiales bacterium]MDP6150735.1 hypothetical protein [Gammaproteobacteria bacterium]MDP7270864.1 hypothetical protein [Gammaproteobacteria bacterium]HJP03888.1 hypothetical protein [Gammaproteobacteria bacterium]